MTSRVNPSVSRSASAVLTAGAIRYAGGSDPGWVGESSTDYLATQAGLSGAPLNAFGSSSSGASLSVTIDTGEAFVGGAWMGKDTTTNVTLAASTTDQTVYAGWDVSQSNTVIIGLSSAFASDDPKVELWKYDTNGSGVTVEEDLRQLGPTVANHSSQHQSTGGDTLDAGDLGGSSGTNGQYLQSDGTDAGWITLEDNFPTGSTTFGGPAHSEDTWVQNTSGTVEIHYISGNVEYTSDQRFRIYINNTNAFDGNEEEIFDIEGTKTGTDTTSVDVPCTVFVPDDWYIIFETTTGSPTISEWRTTNLSP